MFVCHTYFSYDLNKHKTHVENLLAEITLRQTSLDRIRPLESRLLTDLAHQNTILALFNQWIQQKIQIYLIDFSYQEKKITAKGYAYSVDEIKCFADAILTLPSIEFVKIISLKEKKERFYFDLLIAEKLPYVHFD